MISNSFCTQAIISILLVIIVCVFIGISYKDTLVVVILSALVVFLFHMGKLHLNSQEKTNNLKFDSQINNLITENNININNNVKTDNNSNIENKINDTINLSNTSNLANNKNGINNNLVESSEKPYHLTDSSDAIIPAEMYNLDDCTTDKSCIQNPDVNNLFTGFENNTMYLDPKSEMSILPNQKIENKSIKKNNIVVEKFEGNASPLDLVGVTQPYNNAVINPYKNYSMEEEIQTEEDKYLSSQDIGEQLCFNCKIGHCQGGVCRDVNELKSKELKNVVKEINNMKKVHPFSKNFPTIRMSSADPNY